MQIERLIRHAKHEHRTNPVDAAHDYNHHLAVARNIAKIINSEKLDEVEGFEPLVAIAAAWWHDYKRDDPGECLTEVGQFCKQFGVDDPAREAIIGAIRGHSLGNETERGDDIYSELLFDGDKIEYFSRKRFLLALNSVRSEEMSREKFEEYKNKAMKSVVTAYNQLNFATSREMFLNNLRLLSENAQDEDEYVDAALFISSDPEIQRLLGES